MINKKIYLTVITVALFLASSCSNDDEEKKVYLEVTGINLIDIGKIKPFEFLFEIESINDDTVKCTMRTRLIKKNDNLESIEVFTQGNNLNIVVTSYPFDFDCADAGCFTAHDLSFNLTDIKKGSYNVCTVVNYSETNKFHYSIDN
ncbi:MAG: hypothetical protein LBG45_07725 [Dysgonamonadaceae bacterium]|nr:hypothetical protein [Dysgonamonadaceae bacterium]